MYEQNKDNIPGNMGNMANMPIPMEIMQQNLNNYQMYNNAQVFPVKNVSVMDYQADEKKAQSNNFPNYQNDAMKSSDSSFITGFYLFIFEIVMHDFF